MRKGILSSIVLAPLVAAVSAVYIAAGFPALSHAQEEPPAAAEPAEEYDAEEARKSPYINPHQQINDEGTILWESCLVCHTNLPDIKTEQNIREVDLRFSDDLDMLCERCHYDVDKHPAAKGVSAVLMEREGAEPEHLVVPSREYRMNMRLSMKEVDTSLPLDPETQKIICVTCHNPHEKGLVRGRSDTGADSFMRLRTPGVDICQFCHRK